MQPANHCNEIRIAHAKLSQVLEPRVHLRSMLSCPGGSASVPVRKKEREREREATGLSIVGAQSTLMAL